ncbi:MAG TPA: ribosome-associated translation inhibitor RaiA [Candidatus Eisenbacteria bacterium]
MLINTTARHCELDPEDRLHAHQRLERLGRYARDLHEAHLIVSVEKYRHTAEITLKLKHREIVSREESTGARSAIDRAADRLEEQLRRLKERRIDRKQRVGDAAGDTDTVDEDDAGEDGA